MIPKLNTSTHFGKTFVNLIFVSLSNIIGTLFPFIVRTLIIKNLGDQYLGLNSLFTSILGILNVAELGFDNAIVFYMYKPYSSKDMVTTNAFLKLYRKVYAIIGAIVFFIGIVLAPFIRFFIHGTYPDINLFLAYLFFLLQTVSSYYFGSYKSAVLKVTERQDIEARITSVINISSYSLQIISLCIFKSYYIHIALLLIGTISTNVIRAAFVKRCFPAFKCEGQIEKSLYKDFGKKIISITISRLRNISRYSVDSVCLSTFCGLSILAKYQNYISVSLVPYLILGTFNSSVKHSIGIFISEESKDNSVELVKSFTFTWIWVVSWCTICLGVLYQDFISFWIGQEFLLSKQEMICFTVLFFVTGTSDISLIMRETTGLWWDQKKCIIAETIFNVIGDIIIVRYLGICGVLLVSIISIAFISFPWELRILFNSFFKRSVLSYILNLGFYAFVCFVNFLLTYVICNFTCDTIFHFILKCIICIIIPNIVMLFIFYVFKRKYISSFIMRLKKILC